MSTQPSPPTTAAATLPTTSQSAQPQSQTPQTQPPLQDQVSPAQRTAKARTAFTASLRSATANLDSDLQARAKNIHANAKALQKQERDVGSEVKGLKRCNDEMEGLVKGWRGEWEREMGKLDVGGEHGELGDFDLSGIERELGVLEEWVKIVEEESDGEQGSAGSAGQGNKSREEGRGGGESAGTPNVK